MPGCLGETGCVALPGTRAFASRRVRDHRGRWGSSLSKSRSRSFTWAMSAARRSSMPREARASSIL